MNEVAEGNLTQPNKKMKKEKTKQKYMQQLLF
jgi:hypothetical protein